MADGQEQGITLTGLHGRLSAVEARQDSVDDIIGQLRQSDEKLFGLYSDLSDKLDKVATKDDIETVVDNVVNKGLKEVILTSINAIPQYAAVRASKEGNKWLEWAAIGAIGSILLTAILWTATHVAIK